MRNLCKKCQSRPVAVNYYKEGQAYYRSKCDHCSRGSQETRPLWSLSGYKKKTACERCKFTSKHEDQFDVFHVDGDLRNCRPTNLKTICANCARVLHKEGVQWRRGDLIPDF
jgi:hypothetical protein